MLVTVIIHYTSMKKKKWMGAARGGLQLVAVTKIRSSIVVYIIARIISRLSSLSFSIDYNNMYTSTVWATRSQSIIII
jgi:hypothetical protein